MPGYCCAVHRAFTASRVTITAGSPERLTPVFAGGSGSITGKYQAPYLK